jgi:hypothetical protein
MRALERLRRGSGTGVPMFDDLSLDSVVPFEGAGLLPEQESYGIPHSRSSTSGIPLEFSEKRM